MNSIFAIYGASGCGRGIMPLARQQLGSLPGESELVFVDDACAGTSVNGHRVMGYADFLSANATERFFNVAISEPAVRRRIAERCLGDGLLPFTVSAPSVVQMDDVVVSVGASLSPFVTLTSNIRIGRFFHANLYSYVEHDCVIGDFVTFAPGVKCNGNVMIEDDVYIGAGAMLKQGQPGAPLVVGRRSVIGMGAVVTRNVPPGVVVAGNPARELRATK